ARRNVVRQELADSIDHPRCLVVLVQGLDDENRIAGLVLRPELLRLPFARKLDDAERGSNDVAARTVVLLELHYRRVGEVGAEAADVAHVGATPPVDALVVVADDAQVAPLGGQRSYETVLGLVDVLELVDEHVPEAPTQIAAGLAGRILDDVQHLDD